MQPPSMLPCIMLETKKYCVRVVKKMLSVSRLVFQCVARNKMEQTVLRYQMSVPLHYILPFESQSFYFVKLNFCHCHDYGADRAR